jgi:hypothetical protein
VTIIAAILAMLAQAAPSTVPVLCILDRNGQTIIFRAPNASACDKARGITLEKVR